MLRRTYADKKVVSTSCMFPYSLDMSDDMFTVLAGQKFHEAKVLFGNLL